MKGYVYKLINPVNNEIVYIGSTIGSPKYRAKVHVYHAVKAIE